MSSFLYHQTFQIRIEILIKTDLTYKLKLNQNLLVQSMLKITLFLTLILSVFSLPYSDQICLANSLIVGG